MINLCEGDGRYQCTQQQIWRSREPSTRNRPPFPTHDEDGFPTCVFCGGYWGHALAECDTCGKLFKGYKPFPSISYTCPECE